MVSFRGEQATAHLQPRKERSPMIVAPTGRIGLLLVEGDIPHEVLQSLRNPTERRKIDATSCISKPNSRLRELANESVKVRFGLLCNIKLYLFIRMYDIVLDGNPKLEIFEHCNSRLAVTKFSHSEVQIDPLILAN